MSIMTRIIRGFCTLASILLLAAMPAWAQLATAELNGRVTDSSGAVLPGATVTVTQTATGLVRTAVTESNGTYLLSSLPTGPYRLEVSLQGFRTYVQTGIVLQVGATPTINASLAIGALEEAVTVEAAAPLVDVRSAGISNVVEQERIVELPLQGRQVTDLLVISGAAVQQAVVSSRGSVARRRPDHSPPPALTEGRRHIRSEAARDALKSPRPRARNGSD